MFSLNVHSVDIYSFFLLPGDYSRLQKEEIYRIKHDGDYYLAKIQKIYTA